MRHRFIATATALLCLSSSPAMAAPWAGRLATLADAKAACRDIDSNACTPYLAEAAAVADALHTQASSTKLGVLQIPGGDGAILTCGPNLFASLNGQDLTNAALAGETSDNAGGQFYWIDALFRAALDICRAP